MKIMFSCMEDGGFSGKYSLPGFGCNVYVNADNNIVTIDIVDEEEDRINREIEEERLERLEEAMTDDENLSEDYVDEVAYMVDFDDEDDEDESFDEEELESDEAEDDIRTTFEYSLVKSIQEADPSGEVLNFIDKILEEICVKNEDGSYKMDSLFSLLNKITDFTNDKEED